MKSCGIIAEYNPFHNGHLYQLLEAKERAKADLLIVIMSGNFLQRGEPALLDKWIRTYEALSNGADLVIELPFAWAVQSADYFAKGAIKLLHALNCEALCFGTDSSEEINYAEFGEWIVNNQSLINANFINLSKKSLSYPKKIELALQQSFPEKKIDLSSPNHILGLSYARENALYKNPMELYPLKRIQTNFHDRKITNKIASATAIRLAYQKNELEKVAVAVPEVTFNDLNNQPAVTWNSYWPFLKYQLMNQSLLELNQIYQMNEGIEHRLQEAAYKANDFTTFIEEVKTKRYTWTRLQRLAVYILNNIKTQEIEMAWETNYLRILGFNCKGQTFLKKQKKDSQLPIISRVSKENHQQLSLDIRSSRIYQLATKKIVEQDFGRIPIQYLSKK
ncbi:nucleotidyltransferase [Melissococcus plutonius]|uniref:tRNA(Met) cytidine acetate ligase n=1 Tax=Melissococcus plutonius TaxID=33970 RepID=A0A2Z5Y3K1_9ENTE|nr:nucleotidyltransferase [Melissococcus plutonius]MCV2499519.1 nucleotidyltransferase [Melissococcus plutonius]MCV2501322.1 nucleotidyltransferase [Melissococcus plutonius]MCV2505829.1 nucleotidyltransferase [Melissococcus plutonius]MCV2508152.1 nucleotidyltransferase [Melissococcus plutonius]MCV2520535.1 nucleotidyltransferase [Melissococcus plutonius]